MTGRSPWWAQAEPETQNHEETNSFPKLSINKQHTPKPNPKPILIIYLYALGLMWEQLFFRLVLLLSCLISVVPS